jgi:hypothetical protein
MGGMFSARDLETHGVAVHTNGNTAWSEFHWVFRATMRKDGSAVTTHGVETQIYRKQAGKCVWFTSTTRKIARSPPEHVATTDHEDFAFWY